MPESYSIYFTMIVDSIKDKVETMPQKNESGVFITLKSENPGGTINK